MTCSDVRAWLDLEALGLLDDASDDPAAAETARAAVRRHASACAACTARLAHVTGARDAIAGLGDGPPLASEVRERLVGRPPRRSTSVLAVAIAAAAIALLALTLGRREAPPPSSPDPAPDPAPGAIFYTTPAHDLEVQRDPAPPSPAAPAPAHPTEGVLPVGK